MNSRSLNQLISGQRFSAFQLLPSAANRSVFICPEKFGYFPDVRDCTRYFVCVFGEPLHESCTGGLYFSAELQTCDWPRNVLCANQDQNKETVKSFYNIADQGEEDDDYDYNVNNANEKKSNKTIANNGYSGLPPKNFTTIEVGYVNNVDNWEHKPQTNHTNIVNKAHSAHSNQRITQKQKTFRNINENERISTTTSTETPKIITDPLSHNNKINSDVELQAPKYEEAIPSLVDSKGGIHFSDGPGGTYGLNEQLPGVLNTGGEQQEMHLFIKPVFANENDKDFVTLEKSSKHALQRALISQKFNTVPKSKYEYIPVITPEKLFFKPTRNPFDLDDTPQYRTQNERKDDIVVRKDDRGYRSNQREIPKYQQQLFKQHQQLNHHFKNANQSFREYDTINMRNAYSIPNSEVVVIPIVVKEPKEQKQNHNRRGRVRVVPRKRLQSSTPASDNDPSYGVYFDDSRSYENMNPEGNKQRLSTKLESTTTPNSIAPTLPSAFTHQPSPQPQSYTSQSLHLQQIHKYYPLNNERSDYPLPIPNVETYRTTPSSIQNREKYSGFAKPIPVDDTYKNIE
ncbi:uncharacterized protein B4U80_05645, partial [Leptotrombidium deliense]